MIQSQGEEKDNQTGEKRKTMESTSNAKKITTAALLAALALIFSYIEVLIPFNFGIPCIKLGIANRSDHHSTYGRALCTADKPDLYIYRGLLFSGLSGALAG